MHTPVQLSKPALREGKCDRGAFKTLARNPVYIALDSLSCQHNVGCILRMADAVLVEKVFLCGDTHTPPSRKLRKGSRGAEKWVNWEYHRQIPPLLQRLQDDGVSVVAVELCDRSVIYTRLELGDSSPACFVFGGECDGVSPAALAMADHAIQLPMLGMMNSLNVATAASVVLYHDLANRRGDNHG